MLGFFLGGGHAFVWAVLKENQQERPSFGGIVLKPKGDLPGEWVPNFPEGRINELGLPAWGLAMYLERTFSRHLAVAQKHVLKMAPW